jgi:cytochrome c-type biogenesis protein CcmF
LGTLYPLLAEALQLGKISVGPPYFGLLFTLLMAPLVVLLPWGPLTRWQSERPGQISRWLMPWAGLALAAGAIAFFAWPNGTAKTAAAFAAGLWVAFGTLRFVRQRFARSHRRFTAEMIGMCLAHIGVAVFLFGVLMTESLSQEKDVAAKPGQSFDLRGYRFQFDGVTPIQGPNYRADRATIIISRNGEPVATLHPERRAYASGGSIMTESAIDAAPHRDLYVALGESLGADGLWALRLHVKPFIRWIWLGALLMALGGFAVAMDKRFRSSASKEVRA